MNLIYAFLIIPAIVLGILLAVYKFSVWSDNLKSKEPAGSYEEGLWDGWSQGYENGYNDKTSGIAYEPDSARRRYGVFVKEERRRPFRAFGEPYQPL